MDLLYPQPPPHQSVHIAPEQPGQHVNLNTQGQHGFLPPLYQPSQPIHMQVPFTTHYNPSTAHANTQPPINNQQLANNLSAQDVYQQHLRALIEKLQNVNSMQAKEIMELRIKVGILENEVEVTVREKHAATNCLSVVIDALSPGVPHTGKIRRSGSYRSINTGRELEDHGDTEGPVDTPSTVKQLHDEIESLRQKIRYLKKSKKGDQNDQADVHVSFEQADISGLVHDSRRSPLRNTLTSNHRISKDLVTLADQPVQSASHSKLEQNPPSIPRFPTFDSPSFTKGTEDAIKNSAPTPATHKPQPIPSDTVSKLNDSSHEKPLVELNLGFKAIEDLFAEESDEEGVWKKKIQESNFSEPPAPTVKRVGFKNSSFYAGSFSGRQNRSSGATSKWTELKPGGLNIFVPATLHQQSSSSATEISGQFNDASFATSDPSFNSKIWSSSEERDGAISNHQSFSSCGAGSERKFPDIFRFGVQYEPVEGDKNFLRTINISNLPKDVCLRDVLSRVRGGGILMATLCDTFTLLGGMTVRVVFKSEDAAIEYVDFCRRNTISYFSDLEALPRTAVVTLVTTPTYPNHHGRLYNQTRFLRIDRFPSNLSIDYLKGCLAGRIGERAAHLLDAAIDGQNALILEFSSIDAAGYAIRVLTTFSQYRFNPIFIPDPCDGPLQELLGDLTPTTSTGTSFKIEAATDDTQKDDLISFYARDSIKYAAEREALRVRNNKALDLFLNQESTSITSKTAPPRLPSPAGRRLNDFSWADEMNNDVLFSSTTNTNESSISPKQQNQPAVDIASKSTEQADKTSSPVQDIRPTEKSSEKLPSQSLQEYEGVNRLMRDVEHEASSKKKIPKGLSGSIFASKEENNRLEDPNNTRADPNLPHSMHLIPTEPKADRQRPYASFLNHYSTLSQDRSRTRPLNSPLEQRPGISRSFAQPLASTQSSMLIDIEEEDSTPQIPIITEVGSPQILSTAPCGHERLMDKLGSQPIGKVEMKTPNVHEATFMEVRQSKMNPDEIVLDNEDGDE